MTSDEIIDSFEERQMIAMVKLEAYKKVIDNVKRMYESSGRKLKEAKLAIAKADGSSAMSPKLQKKLLEEQAACDVYFEVLMSVAQTAKECKEKMMQEVSNINKLMDEQ